MGLSRTVSEIDGDFSRKSQHFPTPCISHTRLKFPLRINTGAGGLKTREVWWYLQPSGYNTPTCRTDWRTDTGWHQRPHLRKNLVR